ncbi:hypothetical protein H310_10006 [Aphanomyces invadans]|uniref:Peptidase A2 domain-containing protein n=1 Tax=Aphanomyces invadans TaxID=157072 RepID=A0A024TRN4_9STRA|nr:hypothetical protein H310_10006 [Aphanomyces invadans]ETV96688.1 hypothetical protein H310_10006 [Aphanomyces invadans]|eukprot:XP_008874465.1 hypothetical protein H310_10006 [Aphanomyces invadans]
METVVAVPLPPPTQAEIDELRMQSVERAAATWSHLNQMTYEQLAQLLAQQSPMAQRLEEETTRQLAMAAAMDKNRQEQEESRAVLSRQQEELVRQQEELKRAMAEQARVSEAHQEMLRQALDVMRQQHYKVEELNQKRSAFTSGRAAEAPRLENLMVVQQVPFSPTYKGSTKRDRREFMDEYLAYSRRIEVLNRGIGGTLILMPLAACIDQKIVPRVCAHDFGKSFEDITENDRRDYFLSAREVQELDLDAVAKAMASLKMDTKIRDAESRVGRLLADFYEKLEQLDVAHLPEQEPKQSVKILTAAIRPHQLKATVERQLTREMNKAYKSDVRSFCRWLVTLMDNFMLFESQLVVERKHDQIPPRQYGEKARRFLPTKKHDGGASVKTPSTTAAELSSGNGCLKCGSDEHRGFKKPHGTSSAASEKRDDAKSKIIVAAVGSKDALIIDCPRTVACDVNGVTALALLDSGADQSVVSPTFLVRVEKIGNFTLAVRQLDRPIELGGFMEAMKLTVDREVKLRLTFDTAEGTLVLSNLKCWVAAMPLQDGLVDVIVSRNVMARLGYCPHLLLAQARRAQSVYDLNQLGDKETPLIFCSHEGG